MTNSWTKSHDLIWADFKTSGFTNKPEERPSLAQGEQSVMLLTTMFIVPHMPQFVISFKENNHLYIKKLAWTLPTSWNNSCLYFPIYVQHYMTYSVLVSLKSAKTNKQMVNQTHKLQVQSNTNINSYDSIAFNFQLMTIYYISSLFVLLLWQM